MGNMIQPICNCLHSPLSHLHAYQPDKTKCNQPNCWCVVLSYTKGYRDDGEGIMTADTLALLLDYADAMESLLRTLYEKRIPPAAVTCADGYRKVRDDYDAENGDS